ncbi:hypothetical protein DFH08DRAFT_1075391 [Mycena albidolilacea]|uniref:Uncharacterized protein n=1 Tax=Mycena albidolilacea TaxID=1033008 RepID=A0AAD7F032_9AGAR|nr:hypothetical protein DFH08DRAFT_1075391 [Mycena albidolilacea]
MGGDLAATAALRRVLLKVGLKARTAGPVLAPVSYRHPSPPDLKTEICQLVLPPGSSQGAVSRATSSSRPLSSAVTVTEDSMTIPLAVNNQAAMIQSYPLVFKNPESKQLYGVATIGKRPSDCDRLALPADTGLEIVAIDSSGNYGIVKKDQRRTPWDRRTLTQ